MEEGLVGHVETTQGLVMKGTCDLNSAEFLNRNIRLLNVI